MQARFRWLTYSGVAVALGALIGLIGFGAVAPASASTSVHGALRASTTSVSSLNWAGYADTAGTGAVTFVGGSWVEPTVKCPTKGTLYAVFWVGIDGFSSSTVEQTGTLAKCSHGKASYLAWWELYPLNSIQVISSITVKGGDSISASVTFSPSTGFTMKISDTTAGTSFSKTATQSGTMEKSAECIAERPTVGTTLSKLANFGKVTFSSCTATISGTTTGIGAAANVSAITMVDSANRTLASVSTTSNGGATFTVTWVRSS